MLFCGLFYQQLNHSLHKPGLAMVPPTHRHERKKIFQCWKMHSHSTGVHWILNDNPWMRPSANIAAWLGAGLGPNVCVSQFRRTLLHRAADILKDQEKVSHILACGANVNARSYYGRTPLHCTVLIMKIDPLDSVAALSPPCVRVTGFRFAKGRRRPKLWR
jgi:hypothetical protein